MFTAPDGPKPSAVNKIIGTIKLDKQPKPNVKKTGRWLSSFAKWRTCPSPLVLPLAPAGLDANRNDNFVWTSSQNVSQSTSQFARTVFVIIADPISVK